MEHPQHLAGRQNHFQTFPLNNSKNHDEIAAKHRNNKKNEKKYLNLLEYYGKKPLAENFSFKSLKPREAFTFPLFPLLCFIFPAEKKNFAFCIIFCNIILHNTFFDIHRLW